MTIRAAVSAALAAAIALPPMAAEAKDKVDALAIPAAYQAVVDCKALSDAAARLACYDRAVPAMDKAQRGHDIVVTDRAAIREARRGLFGLSLPRIKLFGGGDGDEEVKEINSTLTAIRSANDGMPIFVLEDGARWKQTEGGPSYAKSGDPIRIRRTAMGGFMANIKGGVGVRVIRLAN